MNWFVWIGGLYMIAFPAMIIVGFGFVPHMRFKIVKIGNLLFQLISLFFMTNLLTTKSFYYTSSKNSQTILPGVHLD